MVRFSRWWRLILLPPLLLLIAGLWLLLDWWIVVPPDHPLTFVGREECRRCHAEEMDLWHGSDHDLAMDVAEPPFVVGDFDNATFIRVPFTRWPELGSEAIGLLAARTDDERWAVALKTADEPLRTTLLELLPGEKADAVRAAMANRTQIRPSDATYARYLIGREAARLIAAGEIEAPEMQRSRLWRRMAHGHGATDDADSPHAGQKPRWQYLADTDGPEGREETFDCAYTFGVRPLQQFLVPMSRGRYQCLPIAWDATLGQWYHLYPDEPIPHDDVLHWTGQLQNWNYMCADCHSTNLQKNYDVKTNSYHTTWSEIDVSCEACHGPNSLHVELSDAWSPFWDRKRRFGLPNLKSDNPRVEIETCAPCHARRRVVYPGFKPGDKFLDYYVPELIDTNLYYADGQILDEDYVYGSFIQSLMYRQQVRCTDCHDPHTAKIKLQDNELCGQCHVPAKYDTPQHHHHPVDGPVGLEDASGTLCVECHMPETKYMVVDPRRDHSLRVPRPDLTVSLGIPNACTICHDDVAKGETPQWAAEKCEEWYGPPKGPRHFAYAITAGREGRPEGRRMLQAVAARKDTSGMVRASAISLLGRYPAERPTNAQIEGLRDEDGLVRLAAVRSFDRLPIPVLGRYLPPLLSDPLRAVRTEAARMLSVIRAAQFPADQREAFNHALGEYLDGQHFLGDQAAAHLNIAVIHTNQGRDREALAEYQTALRLDPNFVPARINLGMLYYSMGDHERAEKQLRKAIELNPELAEARYSLGLLLAESPERLAEAVEELGRAAELAPDNPRIRYNLGLALQHLNRHDEAEEELRAAYELTPANTDYLLALAILYAQQERWPKALAVAEELVRRQPENPQFQRMLMQYRRQAGE